MLTTVTLRKRRHGCSAVLHASGHRCRCPGSTGLPSAQRFSLAYPEHQAVRQRLSSSSPLERACRAGSGGTDADPQEATRGWNRQSVNQGRSRRRRRRGTFRRGCGRAANRPRLRVAGGALGATQLRTKQETCDASRRREKLVRPQTRRTVQSQERPQPRPRVARNAESYGAVAVQSPRGCWKASPFSLSCHAGISIAVGTESRCRRRESQRAGTRMHPSRHRERVRTVFR